MRSAVYTRVSTDHDLEQEFNSLDAQREAARAYIKSQAHEGWTLLGESYDDGGFSGGSLDRLALQLRLAAIRAQRIDIVVVYKVDRPTRSLAGHEAASRPAVEQSPPSRGGRLQIEMADITSELAAGFISKSGSSSFSVHLAGKPDNPATIEKYLARKFGAHFKAARQATAELVAAHASADRRPPWHLALRGVPMVRASPRDWLGRQRPAVHWSHPRHRQIVALTSHRCVSCPKPPLPSIPARLWEWKWEAIRCLPDMFR
ncbi:MAG: recombinase family protein [Geminicoccaceae bacterium]